VGALMSAYHLPKMFPAFAGLNSELRKSCTGITLILVPHHYIVYKVYLVSFQEYWPESEEWSVVRDVATGAHDRDCAADPTRRCEIAEDG
jgi:hypothetical protein